MRRREDPAIHSGTDARRAGIAALGGLVWVLLFLAVPLLGRERTSLPASDHAGPSRSRSGPSVALHGAFQNSPGTDGDPELKGSPGIPGTPGR